MPPGMDKVSDKYREVIINVLFALAHQYESLGILFQPKVMDYSTHYDTIVKVPISVFIPHVSEELLKLVGETVQNIYYDMINELVVVRVAKEQ